MGGQLGFILNQITFKPKPLAANTRLEGQTAIVSGANVGIGLEASRQLASHGVSRIILAVRDINKGATAKEDLARTNTGCDFQVWQLDLESLDNILSFAERVKSLDRLDIAILNAAVKKLKWSTAYGHETNVQVNHNGTALLSLLLLPILRSTAEQTGSPSRLTFTSSEAHFWTPFNESKSSNIFERLDEKDSFVEGLERYYTSKLLNVFWFRELASRVDAKEVVINGTNPGFIASQLHRHDSSSVFKLLTKLLAWTPEQGAYFVLDAAAAKKVDSHGAYIQEQKIMPPSKFVLSAEGQKVQKKLWDETVALFKKECPGANLENFIV